MGWNCPECGTQMGHKVKDGSKPELSVSAIIGTFRVHYAGCANCRSEYIVVFRSSGLSNNYIGLVKLWPEAET